MNQYTTCSGLLGYEIFTIIILNYHIPDDTQGPNPGQHFYMVYHAHTAYLPYTTEGQKVARLLWKAFDAGLVFTIGTSHTTGATNTVAWNDIHHKTTIGEGPQRL